MRASLRSALLSAFAGASVAMLAGAGFLLHDPAPLSAAEAKRPATPPPADALPLPPELPRLGDGPEYEACLALLRIDPEAAIARAGSWEERGGGNGARHCQALGLLAIGELEGAASRLERLAAGSHASAAARASVFAQASQAWMMLGAPERAYGASTLALTLRPDDPSLLVDRAVAAASLGRYAEALQDLDHAIAEDDSRPDSWVFRAAALRHLDRADEAMRDVQHALGLEPRHAEALLERGILRQLKGDAAGARADWQETIRVAPDSAAADLAQQNLALNEAGPRRR
ncbi:tetratricopeptide repeat protein [Roseomonas sp. M0104]|uniref:Tetratricopeptide repeat protein n=1 Tax=Teichococcus coralli TaxID=2545983 RepID=A0A845BA83_9PROT|nr:tetratricopeptide repeat protein [Pseudoroseomonas coralli]MXP63685.1 tetratricopeptide repeat protein [Pseudoroseomonas coralli]